MSDALNPQKQEYSLDNEILTVNEVAEFLRISRITVWRLCQQEIIPCFRIGRSWRIPREAFLNFLEAVTSAGNLQLLSDLANQGSIASTTEGDKPSP